MANFFSKTYVPTFSTQYTLISAAVVAAIVVVTNLVFNFFRFESILGHIAVFVLVYVGVLLVHYYLPKISSYNLLDWTLGKQIGINVLSGLVIYALLALVVPFINGTFNFKENIIFCGLGILGSIFFALFNQATASDKIEAKANDLARSISRPFEDVPVAKNGVTSLALSNSGKGGLNLLPNQIIMAESRSGQVDILVQNLKGVETKTYPINLSTLERDLEIFGHFNRLTDNVLINLNAIKSIERDGSGISLEVAKTGRTFPITLEKANTIINKLS